MESLQACLYQISNALMIPTMVALLFLTAWMIVLLGGFIREWVDRGKQRTALSQSLNAIKGGPTQRERAWEALKEARGGLPERFYKDHGTWPSDELTRAKAVEDLELSVARSMSTLSFITRVAPMLGLMGTLIPLGPALTGLATGNIKELAGNLVVAFTATVLGILVGGCTYGMSLARRTWYNQDLSDLEFLSQKAVQGGQHAA